MKKSKHAISPSREENFSEWYQQVIRAADLAENSSVRGCMVIKPWGYGIWEQIRDYLNGRIRATGHENAYFPLFIPKHFLEREADHVEGFAKECALVTHSRLVRGEKGLDIADPLEEPLVVRPTSETIIGDSFSRWIQSYRDLPLLINQWANVVRWEMRPRLFLRTSEFLWQEGHTAHATEEEARQEADRMIDEYRRLAEEVLSIPVLVGQKSALERFPGAQETLCIEAMMQDGKALQAATSHFLGQNFARAYDIQFLATDGERRHVWTTSWGATTRLVGALIMTHGDDDGLILPPRVAPLQAVILPILRNNEQENEAILEYAHRLDAALGHVIFAGQTLRKRFDDRDLRGGEKSWGWIKKGVPLILEVGAKEVQEGAVFLRRRDDLSRQSLPLDSFIDQVPQLLQSIQEALLLRARETMRNRTERVTSLDAFRDFFRQRTGFLETFFAPDSAREEEIGKELSVSLRCFPRSDETGPCFCSGRPARLAVWAKSY